MNVSVSMLRTIRTAVSLAVLTTALALAACETDGTGPSAADEKANPHQDLDKRADVVNKCIDDKLKAAGVAAPKT